MTVHKNRSRSQLVIDCINTKRKRKLGRIQAGVLRALLENGTYPGTWYWHNTSSTKKTLEQLAKHGLVETQDVPLTDMRGEPDPHGRTTIFYRPAQWMLDAMNAHTEKDALTVLEDAHA